MSDALITSRSVKRWLVLVCALTVLGSVISYNLYTMREQLIEQEQQRLMTQARVIGRNMERQLDATNRALHQIVKIQSNRTVPQSVELAGKRLSILADAMPGVRTLFITDGDGTVLAANRPELTGRNFKQREYFSLPQQQPDLDRLYVSPPFRSVLNAYVFNITRMIPDANGRFSGVVTAGVDQGYFEAILQSVIYAPDMLTSINHGNGLRFMTVPAMEGHTGRNIAGRGSPFLTFIQSGKKEHIHLGPSYLTGEQRLVAMLTVRPPELVMDQPLYVVISRSTAAIFRNWKNEALFQGALLLAVCIGSALALELFNRHQNRLERAASRADALVQLRYALLDFATMHTAHELLQHALDEVCRISESPVGFYHFVDPDQQALSLQAWSTRTLQEFCTAGGHSLHYAVDQAGVWAEPVRTRAPAIHNDYGALPGKKELPSGHAPLVRELVVPVIRDERVVALLGVGNKVANYTAKDAEEILYLADVAWEIIDSRRAQEELKKANEMLATQSRIDFLTGIYNRRMFDTLMNAEIARSCRYNSPLSLIMIDIDHFKQVNDTLGHAAGDLVLQKVAELISGRVRSHDVFSRWGGEEFVIMTPKNDLAQAAALAQILREMIEQFDFGNGRRITVSFGVTQHRCGEAPELFVARADAALYQAKYNGRNRVETIMPDAAV